MHALLLDLAKELELLCHGAGALIQWTYSWIQSLEPDLANIDRLLLLCANHHDLYNVSVSVLGLLENAHNQLGAVFWLQGNIAWSKSVTAVFLLKDGCLPSLASVVMYDGMEDVQSMALGRQQSFECSGPFLDQTET